MEGTKQDIKSGKRWKWYRISLFLITVISFAAICVIMLVDIYHSVPDTIYLKAGEESNLSMHVPLSGDLFRQEKNEISETIKSENMSLMLRGEAEDVASDSIHVDLTNTVTMYAGTQNTYSMKLKLFGVIPFKTVRIEVIDTNALYPMGMPIGIYVKTTGVLVVGTGDFRDYRGNTVMPSEHLLQTGDYILSVNGSTVNGKSDFVNRVANSDGKTMIMTIERNGEQFDIGIRPERNDAGEYKLGIWVKDSAQGIGTLTYMDADGNFGALGHGVSDSDIGVLLNLSDGALYSTDIIGITKGQKGVPGELTGIIRYTESNRMGEVTDNSQVGIHGSLESDIRESVDVTPIPIGLKQDVLIEEAQIYCNVDGEADYYDIRITNLDYDSDNINKGITFVVTDSELISITGGIVQGMSGSPIIQDGKIIGAVTHVLVNDPEKGYGIFIESMLEHGN